MADPNTAFFSLLLLLPLSLLLILYFIVRPRPAKIPIKNRHVFITGGSSGIGLALARRVASEGARVSILARDHAKLQAAKQDIQLATGADVAIFSADVRDFAAVKMAVEATGPIDVLVCNQGVFLPQELENQPLDEVKFMIDVNLMGTFHLIKAALPLMKIDRQARGPASIAIISSQAGQICSMIFCENKRRPELTTIIAGSSGVMKADEVAKKAIDGIRSGRFIVPCNFEGLLLSIATAGLGPQRSYLMAFVEVLAAGIIRLAGLFFQWTWYGSIEKWHAQNFSLSPPPPTLFPRYLYFIVRPRPVQIPIKDRHVFISGGSCGTGLAIARRAASEGARVSILARDHGKLKAAKQEIRAATGASVAVFSADVRDFPALKKAVEAAGPIDVLVCNHEAFMAGEMEKQSPENVQLMIDIGIYGYTGYSATKFGLRGLAEALQQEVITDNIHVSLIFPPDTQTPGFEEENKRRLELTKIIANSSTMMKSEEVAKKTMDGIRKGSFHIRCNFKGLILSTSTAGFSPQRSFLMAFVEILVAGIARLIGLFHLWTFYRSIEKRHCQTLE
ncbi:hypothetical protein Cgig2_002179 [Carnegiea gigantea]|uniref:3-dehydrosphinganine reductase n=1 Tax=Carnegiea gigantea TaxID=171969 RepID=A0A9Q1QQJ8_9CARY|nr:hypothetical protein Cgig2_002179 [Carnegiea gigantea]